MNNRIESMESDAPDPKTGPSVGGGLNKALWAVLGVLCLAAVICFLFVDNELTGWLVRQRVTWRRWTWPMGFRQMGKAWALVWLLCLWFWVTRRSRPALCALLALVLTLPLVLPLKGLVDRVRPGVAIAAAQSAPESKPKRGNSFPSGDTATVFAVVAALIGFVRRRWLCLLFAAALGIGMLRVVVLAHYASDVCIGIAIGLWAGHIARVLDRRLGVSTEWLDQRSWIALPLLVALPLIICLTAGTEPVLFFYQTFGAVAGGLALICKICIWRSQRDPNSAAA
jgi:membrane-associated phospholipid phosphatase